MIDTLRSALRASSPSLTRKILLGLGGLSALWTLTIAVIVGEFRVIDRRVGEMATTTRALWSAVATLEVSTVETGAAVLRYLADATPAARNNIAAATAGTAERLERFLAIAGPELLPLGERFRARYGQLADAGQRLAAFRDHERLLLDAFTASLASFEDKLALEVPMLDMDEAARLELERRLVTLRSELAHVIGRLSVNLGMHGDQGRDPATAELVRTRQLLIDAALRTASPALAAWLRDLGGEMGRLASLSREAEAVRNTTRAETDAFIALEREIGSLLTNDLQGTVDQRLGAIASDADRLIAAGLTTAGGFALVGVLATIVVLLLFHRQVVLPLRALADGAARVGAGDFAHPVSAAAPAHDEIGRLVVAFNAMMAQVSETQRVLTGRTLSLNDAVAARTAELERANAALRDALASADRANAAKTAFLAAMSHELRTPLNAIIGFSEIIASNMLGAGGAARYREYAKDITDSGHHLLAIINDLLDMVKIEAGKLDLHFETVAVEVVIEEVMRMLRGRISEAKLDCHLALAPDLAPVRADRRIVKQVLVNLLSNAIKFTPPAGKITIAAHRDDGFVALSVADTGIGMTADEVAQAAEPFYQADRSLARRFGGTGLGLTLVKAFVEQHGGRFAIASEPAAGTTIAISFPVAPPGEAAPAPAVPQLAAAAPPMR
jgi:signal transduction histidine kinase